MCRCEKLREGAQLFRIRSPRKLFTEIADIGPEYEHFLAARKVWQCDECQQLFALMRIPYQDEENILVRAMAADWQNWDWEALASIADRVRWRGPESDPRYVL